MPYKDLQDLLQRSAAARTYFQSLPTQMQLSLREQNDRIHSAEALFQAAESLIHRHGAMAFFSGEI